MRPAIAIGTSLDGERVAVEVPWRARVEYGEVVLGCRWPADATALRGAICTALGPSAHVDLHGHLPDGTTRQARATVCYRVRDGQPVVWAYGPRAHDHLATVARIAALRTPASRVVEIEDASLSLEALAVGLHKELWYRYEFATPYYPSSVADARKPRGHRHGLAAWAGAAVASSIRMVFGDLGLATEAHRPVHVQIDDLRIDRARWRDRETRHGFRARLTTNAILPPGIGLGQHVAEGFGEVRPCR